MCIAFRCAHYAPDIKNLKKKRRKTYIKLTLRFLMMGEMSTNINLLWRTKKVKPKEQTPSSVQQGVKNKHKNIIIQHIIKNTEKWFLLKPAFKVESVGAVSAAGKPKFYVISKEALT